MESIRRHGCIEFFRFALVLFMILVVLRLWFPAIDLDSSAQAQIPDSGLQRKLLLDELQKTNQTLITSRQNVKHRLLNAE
jgi:hypothetical protein